MIHQFVAAGLAIINPDNPSRPMNSGQTVYQVPPELIATTPGLRDTELE